MRDGILGSRSLCLVGKKTPSIHLPHLSTTSSTLPLPLPCPLPTRPFLFPTPFLSQMGRRPWASNEQIKYMLGLRIAFLKHKDQKTLPDFWETTNAEWFSRWPNRDPELEDLQKAGDSLGIADMGDAEVVRVQLITRIGMYCIANKTCRISWQRKK